MIDALRRNVTRGLRDVALYGVEQVTQPTQAEQWSPMPSVTGRPSPEEIRELLDSLPAQPLHVAVLAAGRRELPGTWGPGSTFGPEDALEAARTVARAAGVEFTFRSADHLPWHPGRCAAVVLAGTDTVVGHAGELHPQVCERSGIPARSVALEIDLDALDLTPTFPRPLLSPFPPVLQDVALVLDETVPAADVEAVLRAGAGDLLEDVRLFDVYRSDDLGEGRRSLTFSLRFRAADRTLTEDEASAAREDAVARAREELGAELRS